ncbi:MBL fold metallo-hydrolase [Lacihabitans sp. LS3-19]|uniref:MBL fold metallo-hydrolase RNA specificity domain-containing protein n=1 Tax=Lacihabitans sp. LS3-19 TaxID=2487335 RepID=UPI0020CEF04E|nr:MBL fold metallo-hydrolase [Lacihabitans sp. LS3-19]MCP9769850.1 MBL fold metallo-hydrolase [Lacihabitans sp. LS3-19]
MRLTFFGAARKVTGSMFLLELEDDYRILIDCGTTLDGSRNLNEKLEYGNFPFDASLVNTVFLTHAHIDHSGQIPNLYSSGFEGQVLCTSPTMDLTELLLHDAAVLNSRIVKNIEKSHKKSKKWKSIETQGLYLRKQVDEALNSFLPLAFGHRFRFKDDGYVTFYPAGHLLGAAHIVVEVLENGQMKKIGFSGDIGRKNFPLLVDPKPMPQVDYLVMESTYGNREHTDKISPEEMLRDVIQESCIDITGRLIVPSFSVGRTQCLLYTLNRLYQNYDIKPIKVFTDSPLAKVSTKVYEKHRKHLNKEATDFFEETDSLFDFENLHYLESDIESKAASLHTESCIIISSSGMIKGGRVEHHVEKNIENPYATILMVGYATEDSVGGRLLSGDLKDLQIRNKKLAVNAKIKKIDVFSGHGDLNDLISFAENQDKNILKNIFLVHGDVEAMFNFKEILNNRGFSNIELPEQNQSFEL